jgi:hypothetical protein
MTKTSVITIYAMAAIVIVAACVGILLLKNDKTTYAKNALSYEHSDETISSDLTPESCTIFTASFGDTVLFGNNEDWINPNTYYWVVPPGIKDYGVVYFGFDNFWPQGGINEKGLAYDVHSCALQSHHEENSRTGDRHLSITPSKACSRRFCFARPQGRREPRLNSSTFHPNQRMTQK